MVLTLTLPDQYGYVILGNVVVPFISAFYMSASVRRLPFVPRLHSHAVMQVMKARKDCDVQYPNLYATPGYHKQADEFNRVQRGHQSLFESLTFVMIMGLVGGIKHPLASAVSGFLYSIGSILYLMGYADTSVKVDMARHVKGGPIKTLGRCS